MLVKYFIYRFLLLLGIPGYSEKIDRLILERVMTRVKQNDLFIDYGWSNSDGLPTLFEKYHLTTFPYFKHLLEEVAKGDTHLCGTNSLLMNVFETFPGHYDRMFFAKHLLNDKGNNFTDFVLLTVPTSYWDINVEERKSTMKFWLKDIPEHSRSPSYLNKRSTLSFADNILKEFYEILEFNKTPTVVTKHYLAKCHDEVERVATTKYLIQKHVLTKMKEGGINLKDQHADLAFFGTWEREKYRVLG